MNILTFALLTLGVSTVLAIRNPSIVAGTLPTPSPTPVAESYTSPDGAFTLAVTRARPEVGKEADDEAKITHYIFDIVAGSVYVDQTDLPEESSDAEIDAKVNSVIQQRRGNPDTDVSDIKQVMRGGFRGKSFAMLRKDYGYLVMVIAKGTRYFEINCQFKRNTDEAKMRPVMQQILDSFMPAVPLPAKSATFPVYAAPEGRFAVSIEGNPAVTQLDAPQTGEKYKWTTPTTAFIVTRNVVNVGSVADDRVAAVTEQFRQDLHTLYKDLALSPATPLQIGSYKGAKFGVYGVHGRVVAAVLVGPSDVYRISNATTDMTPDALMELNRVIDSFTPKSVAAAAAALPGPVGTRYVSPDARFAINVPGSPTAIEKMPNGDTRFTWNLNGGTFSIRESLTKHPLSKEERRAVLAQFDSALKQEKLQRPTYILDFRYYSLLTYSGLLADGEMKEIIVPTSNAIFDIKFSGPVYEKTYWDRIESYYFSFAIKADGESDYKEAFAINVAQ